MKLARFGDRGRERPAIVASDGVLRDVSMNVPDFTPGLLGPALVERLAGLDPADLPEVDPEARLGSPLPRTGHFLAIGLNYADHAAETGQEPPKEPVVFSKAPSCLSGPNDEVELPAGSKKTDWEVELAVIIGDTCDRVKEKDALSKVFGYAICNDVSERAWQTEGTGQWIKGKSAPTFGPLGPYIVTTDEIPDPQALDLYLDLNGKRMQTGNTSTMIFSVAELVSYLSRHMVLMPGDIVTTGTPPGVGMGMKPQRYLRSGDVMQLGITGLGEQKQKVVRRSA